MPAHLRALSLLASLALLLAGCCCPSVGDQEDESAEEAETEAEAEAEPPAPPPIPFREAFPGPEERCEESAEAAPPPTDPMLENASVEALFASPRPAPQQKARLRCRAGWLYLFEYPDESGARSAVLRMAGRVFHGDRPIVTHRWEVLRRGPLVAFVSATNLAATLIRERQFRPALEGRTLVDRRLHGAAPFGGIFENRGSELTDTRFIRRVLDCEREPEKSYCEALLRYEGFHSVDPPRDFPVVHLGRCLRIGRRAREEGLCWLLWSPLGVRLGSVTPEDMPAAQIADTLARLRSGQRPSEEALGLADALIDRGPGHPTDVRFHTRRAPPMGEQVTYIRGTDSEIIAIDSRDSIHAQRVALFSLR